MHMTYHYNHCIITFGLFTVWAINMHASKTSMYMSSSVPVYQSACTHKSEITGWKICLYSNTKQYSLIVRFGKTVWKFF